MTTVTTPRMTVEEIRLMRAIVRWRRANGVDLRAWRGCWVLPDGSQISYETTDPAEVAHEPQGRGGLQWIRVRSVTQAVDLLVALGYLPARFSSAYRAGWHAAEVWHGTWINDEYQQDAEFAHLFHDPENISFPVGVYE